MRRRTLLLWLGLLLWAEPASAQKVYELTVSQQVGVQRALTKEDVKSILQSASENLQRHGCDVKFTLKGEIGTFTSAPAVIETASDLEAAHNVPADVKIVEHIRFCVGKHLDGGYVGCSWRPPGLKKTMIVSRLAGGDSTRPFVWAHEFGHTTGLQHRLAPQNLGLMTPCPIKTFNEEVDEKECKCFLGGPGSCNVPQSAADACPNDRNSD